jgi:molybdopterin synthase catalytic subunit
MSENVTIQLVERPLGPPTAKPPAGAGAWIVFDGIVRPAEEARPLAALVYEAYEPMTSRELHRLAQTTLDKHCLLAMVVEHSTGRVAAGEASFRLSIGAPHRAEAIRAADEFISEMKKVVPIWKTPEFAGVFG